MILRPQTLCVNACTNVYISLLPVSLCTSLQVCQLLHSFRECLAAGFIVLFIWETDCQTTNSGIRADDVATNKSIRFEENCHWREVLFLPLSSDSNSSRVPLIQIWSAFFEKNVFTFHAQFHISHFTYWSSKNVHSHFIFLISHFNMLDIPNI